MKNIINNTENIKSNIIEMEKSKILENESKLIKRNLYYLIISTAIALINFFIIWPITEKCHAFSEGGPMTLKERAIVFIISAPILLIYIVYFFKKFKNLRYFNFLNYPLIILNVVMLGISTFLSLAGYGLVFLVLILPIFVSITLLFLSIIYGAYIDTKFWKKYSKIRKGH